MTDPGRWYDEVREIHDRHFDDPWTERAEAINARYSLTGSHRLVTPELDRPLLWFIGDIERVEAGRWVLVVSLNHQANPDTMGTDHLERNHDAADYWDRWRMFNTEHWYRDFFGPLARVAAGGLGETLPRDQEAAFATSRMLFVEVCPYGSHKFAMPRSMLRELAATDLGFQLASRVNRILIERGHPALVLVNGATAMDAFEDIYGDLIDWSIVRYDSRDEAREGRKRKRLWHRQGWITHDHGRVPVVGFPFLRTMGTHNSNAEVDQLTAHVRLWMTRCQSTKA